MTPDESLRAELEAWIDETDGAEYVMLNDLMRLCRQREAETWREAAELAIPSQSHHDSSRYISGYNNANDLFRKQCEKKANDCEAQALEGETGK